MDMLNPDIWKQQWAVFVSAPYIIGSFIAGAGLIGWWLRGIKSGRGTDGLKGEIAGLKGEIAVFGARLKFADERVAWANKVKDEGVKAIEAARQFEDLRAEIKANEGSALDKINDEVKVAVEKLAAANNAVRAIAIAAGVSARVDIGESPQGEVIRADRERLNEDPT